MRETKNLVKKSKTSKIIFFVTMIFLYAPFAILIVLSFNQSRSMNFTGFSLKWYYEFFFKSTNLWRAFANSITIAILSATASTIIGTLGAIGIYWYRFKFKKYLEIVSYLPLILPEIIIGVALLMFFSGIKFKLGLITIFIAHTTFNLPYVLFIVMARLAEFDYSIIEASYDLGAKELQALMKVIIPISLPGIISGFLMAFTLSLDDFVITFFVTGPGASTLPLHIYSMLRFGVSPVINVLSVFLIVVSILLAISSKKMYKYMFN